jgi:hypothetical protein
VATTPPWPFDDPMSLYLDNPDREWAWLSASMSAFRFSVSLAWVITDEMIAANQKIWAPLFDPRQPEPASVAPRSSDGRRASPAPRSVEFLAPTWVP